MGFAGGSMSQQQSQRDAKKIHRAITGAVNNGSGLIRITATAHGFQTSDWITGSAVGGVPNATGQWLITVITANTFDLVGSTFAGAYTSGGDAARP
jgi:hypothetical protein